MVHLNSSKTFEDAIVRYGRLYLLTYPFDCCLPLWLALPIFTPTTERKDRKVSQHFSASRQGTI